VHGKYFLKLAEIHDDFYACHLKHTKTIFILPIGCILSLRKADVLKKIHNLRLIAAYAGITFTRMSLKDKTEFM
jgi:hypothetical protein